MALALSLAGGACKPKAQSPPAVAAVAVVAVEAKGTVWRTRGGGAREPISAGALDVGDVLSTGPDGGAILRLPQGRQMELAPNARLRLRKGADGSLVVDAESGTILWRTPATPPAGSGGGGGGLELTILTPFGITRVPAGAGEASIEVGPNGVRIDVVVGAVTFTGRDGSQVTAKADETINVTMGKVEVLRTHAARSGGTEPLDVLLSAEQGPLLVRRPGEGRFFPRRAVPAPAGTGFKVAATGRARVVSVGLRAVLAAGAAGTIGEATRGPAGLRAAMTLDEGRATITLDGNEAKELKLGEGAGAVVVRATEPTTLSVIAGPHGPTVEVLAGAADLVVGDEHRHLDPTVRAQINGQHLAVKPRRQPEVILPTARGLRVFADRLGEVTLSWPDSLTDASVEVASDPELKDLVATGRPGSSSMTVPAPSRADLYWRVTGKTDGVERVLLGHARFDPDRHRSVLDLERPRNLVTEAGPVTTVYFQGTLPALTFAFAHRAGASRYRLRVFRDEDLEKPIVDRLVTDTRSAIDASLFREGRYVWSALGVDGKGHELGGGRMNKLELVYDNALTTLAIGSPRPSAAVTGPRVDATGVAPLGSKLFINGLPAALDGKGRFAMRVPRTPSVVFRLVSPDGSERYWVRRLRGPS